MSPPILDIEEVTKTYDGAPALDRLSLTVTGGIFGLLGANGAGKSTLFRGVLDLARPDAGSIRVAGHDVVRDALAARPLVGYLPEELDLDDFLTGSEHLELIAGLRGLENPEERRELLTYFGIDHAADQLIRGYSLGMRKKLGIAAALLGPPRLVLLDEPLNGLDTEHMRKFRQRIQALAAEGTTFVLSSHVMAFVERVCDRMAVLRNGRLVIEGTAEDLRKRAAMPEEAFEDVFLALAS